MAWYTQQIPCDFINRIPNHKVVENKFRSILSNDVVMEFGTRVYRGKEQVLRFFEENSVKISSEAGFTVKPVIICNTVDDAFGIVESKRYYAFAYCSKLEEFISWFFLIKADTETGQIYSIRATRGTNYKFYYEIYIPKEYTE